MCCCVIVLVLDEGRPTRIEGRANTAIPVPCDDPDRQKWRACAGKSNVAAAVSGAAVAALKRELT